MSYQYWDTRTGLGLTEEDLGDWYAERRDNAATRYVTGFDEFVDVLLKAGSITDDAETAEELLIKAALASVGGASLEASKPRS